MLLPENELAIYVPESARMTEENRLKFLQRANAYALGIIGGIPTYTIEKPDGPVKTAVGMAFEILTEGQDAQTNPVNGNVTEAAPTGWYVRRAERALDVVDRMLEPYADEFRRGNSAVNENGMQFF
ncbi:hypothetical protein [Exiguobacterium sp. AT1b]|uniref:Uncharacterized protein n=1 Tax=Exiguobacterium sp. (strain ATCC BAA-1283 / AT1b) TaxID=360911 RepID=C4L0Q1_EXISA|nr:hypothetical protein [Exiguobacterium sp. AT1b]ACQ68969.1 hypothetical protein EAT1b_0034 [Exiguobacterium sp. AT1b]